MKAEGEVWEREEKEEEEKKLLDLSLFFFIYFVGALKKS